MWISNTATTLMMLPIAIAVLDKMAEDHADIVDGMGLALMLGIAYAASVGGMGTPIGTPPNVIFMKLYEEQFPHAEPIGFLQWMLFALPVVMLLLGLIWWYLVNVQGKIPKGLGSAGQEVITKERRALGKISRPEKRVAIVFAVTALLWVFRKSITLGDSGLTIPGWSPALGLDKMVDDSTVALAAALACFVIPAGSEKRDERLLDWDTAVRIPWGLLLLFGGGIALAKGFGATGLSAYVGSHMTALSSFHTLLVIVITCLLVTFLTEVTSNTATTNILIPILGMAAVAMEKDPLLLMIPATLSASCAFMLPVATAPNAIVFGSGKVTIAQMARAGFAINVFAALVIALALYFFGLPLLGAKI
jgi:sodium-dependent dicarboxylate transporter 2/3/5